MQRNIYIALNGEDNKQRWNQMKYANRPHQEDFVSR
jgi:hypothetical protein